MFDCLCSHACVDSPECRRWLQLQRRAYVAKAPVEWHKKGPQMWNQSHTYTPAPEKQVDGVEDKVSGQQVLTYWKERTMAVTTPMTISTTAAIHRKPPQEVKSTCDGEKVINRLIMKLSFKPHKPLNVTSPSVVATKKVGFPVDHNCHE